MYGLNIVDNLNGMVLMN